MFSSAPLAKSVCWSCRLSLSQSSRNAAVSITSSFHSSTFLSREKSAAPPRFNARGREFARPQRPTSTPTARNLPIPITFAQIRTALRQHLSKGWEKSPNVRTLLSHLDLEAGQKNVVRRFVTAMLRELGGGDHDAPIPLTWDVDTLREQALHNVEKALEEAILLRFLDWAPRNSVPTSSSLVPDDSIETTPSSSLSALPHIKEAIDYRFFSERFPEARAMHRKIILHVGPTNSGKTYNALRALAGAKTGVYAGPLRLLAHEVWERMNRGLITAPIPQSNLDLEAPVVETMPEVERLQSGRACNLITGEEQRIVAVDAGLVSCTVEMLSTIARYDVAVIDEIQMIGDAERGGGWTNALLGVCASEVHLCGEDTVLELVKDICRETGDELVINRYQRLSPLVVSKTSLNHDLSEIRKGDCLVAFARSTIFQYKKLIEARTGLKCAVAYGRLPPEVRSEQAHLFNDPDSGYDVMVASDAVGMGLNLKIKRIVFETLHKFDGQKEVPLSLSQIKQIAGRAGRFGLHSESSVGEVTTLDPSDLPILEKAMKSVNPPVSKARVIPASYVVEKIYETLPRNPKLSTIYDIISRLSVFRTSYDLADLQRRANLADFLEEKVLDLNLHDKIILCDAPTPWNDPTTREVMGRFAQAFATRLSVDLLDGLKGHPGLVAFENVKVLQQTQGSTTTKKAETEEKKAAPMTPYTLMQLESLHRSIVLYLWLTYRLPLAFSQQEFAVKMKDEVEKAIQFSLEALRSSKERRSGRAVGKNGESARRSERDYGALTWTTSRRMDLFGKTVKLQPSS